MDQLQKRVETPMSESDLMNIFGDIHDKIKLYSDLSNYNSIEELLPNKRDFCIILIEDKKYSGHWVLLLRNNKTIEYFNSYGTIPSTELKLLTMKKREDLNQKIKYLNLLLYKASKDGYNVVYNTTRFQKLKNNSQTCGRHVSLRLLSFLNKNISLDKYINLVEKLKNELRLNADELVSLLI